MEPKSWWFVDVSSFSRGYFFFGAMLVFGRSMARNAKPMLLRGLGKLKASPADVMKRNEFIKVIDLFL